ncbi:MAG: hypothetical protein COA67_00925 [Lutibacter sp.]|nr:MAG: hypothetical protein COA67_00925 [Lutibacter sp.]
MKKRLLVASLLLFSFVQLVAQDIPTFSVTGKVVDKETSQTLEYATVILSPKPSGDIIGCITDKKGKFKLEVPKGNYDITVEFLSYKSKKYSKYDIINDTHLGNIQLEIDTEALESVDITIKKKITERRIDKIIYNVDQDALANGGMATDILANAPSVIVTDGVPTIRGANATVMINGRISAMSKTEALQSLPASNIKKIEIITSPGAKYRADITGGIINIILKKGLDNGFNGSITATANNKELYGVGTTINYRKKKLNFYTNTSYFHRKPIENTTIENEYLDTNLATIFLNENRKNSRKSKVFLSTLGLEYTIDDYKSLTLEGSFSDFNGDLNNLNTSDYLDINKTLSRTNQLTNKLKNTDKITELSLIYDQYFERRENEELYIQLTHYNDVEKKNSYLSNKDLFPTTVSYPEEDERIFENIDLINTTWLIAYARPLNETSMLEFGTDGELGKYTNDFKNETIVGGNFEINPATTNILEYKENWFGFYGEYSYEKEKYSYKLGLRTEITDLDLNLLTTGESTNQNYTDLFPSASFNYNLTENKSLSLSYRRGIIRADAYNLNPFEHRISETNSFVGNSDLLPFYPNKFELSLLNNSKKKLVLNPTLYHRNYKKIWQSVTYETGEFINGIPKLLTTYVNLGNLNFSGIEISTSYKPNDWLSFRNTIDLNYVTQNGVFEHIDSNNQTVIQDFKNDNFGGSTQLITSVKLPKDFKVQTTARYNLASEGAHSKRFGYGYLNASASKDLFSKRATLSLYANDMLNSNRTKRNRFTENLISRSNRQYTEPFVQLSFTYRFNQSKKNRDIDINKKDEDKGNF